MTFERPQAVPGFDIPDMEDAVIRSADTAVAVRGNGKAFDEDLVTFESPEAIPVIQIPDTKGTVY